MCSSIVLDADSSPVIDQYMLLNYIWFTVYIWRYLYSSIHFKEFSSHCSGMVSWYLLLNFFNDANIFNGATFVMQELSMQSNDYCCEYILREKLVQKFLSQSHAQRYTCDVFLLDSTYFLITSCSWYNSICFIQKGGNNRNGVDMFQGSAVRKNGGSCWRMMQFHGFILHW